MYKLRIGLDDLQMSLPTHYSVIAQNSGTVISNMKLNQNCLLRKTVLLFYAVIQGFSDTVCLLSI